jgi:N-acetyl-1-D-myo-inositol-2-amino-2-deoxy-alpha-D-glucopyranoside deacetylase
MSDAFDFKNQHLLAILAHPDDEAFGSAGTFAFLTDHGAQVTLVCATRGEVGEISDPALATPENLGAVREQELKTAMSKVGVSDVRFLDYRDSGMDGTDDNKNPRAFVNAGVVAVTDRLRGIIDEIKPDAVLTFAADGVYGHPDHLMISRTATAAVLTADWETPALYYTAIPREMFEEMAAREVGPFADMAAEVVARMGTPSAEIHLWIDVKSELERKLACLMAHRTQMGEDGPLADLPRDIVMAAMSVETYLRVPLPWKTPVDGLFEHLPEGPHTKASPNGA